MVEPHRKHIIKLLNFVCEFDMPSTKEVFNDLFTFFFIPFKLVIVFMVQRDVIETIILKFNK
jgi:hypothetical protein